MTHIASKQAVVGVEYPAIPLLLRALLASSSVSLATLDTSVHMQAPSVFVQTQWLPPDALGGTEQMLL